MTLAGKEIVFGTINFWVWLVLFVATFLYEKLTVQITYALLRYRSIVVANISVGIGAIGMGCVVVYTAEFNTTIPILAATWVANYYAVEKAKRDHERDKAKDSVKSV